MSRKKRRKKENAPEQPAAKAKELSPRVPTRLDTLSNKQGWSLFLLLNSIIACIVFAPYLLGQKLYIFKDIGSDTVNLIVPRMVHIADYIRQVGVPGWSFNMGMGQSIYPNSLGAPFELALMLMGPDAVPYLIGWLEVIKITAAGALMIVWLRLRDYDWVPCVFAALGFAFCGSIIVGGGWYSFSTAAVYAMLVPVGYELLKRRKNWLIFAIVVAIIASYNVFHLATLGLFGLAYFAIRAMATQPDWRALGKEAAILLGLAVIGGMISGVFSLEAAAEILSSPRVAGEASYAGSLSQKPIFAMGDERFYGTIILRTLSNDLLGTGNSFQGWYNYLEAPMNYCTILALLLLPQAFIFLNKRRRVVFGIALALVLGIQVFSYFRYMFWFFAGDYFRNLSTLISFAYLALGVYALQEINRQRRANLQLLAGTAVILLIMLHYGWSWNHKNGAVSISSKLAGFCSIIIVAEAGLIWALASGRNRLAAQAGLLGVVALELLILSYTPVNSRHVFTAEDWQNDGYNDASAKALAQIREQDDGFYRVHKYFASSDADHSSINDALIQDFYGSSSYFSFNQPNYLYFLEGMGIIDLSKEFQSRWAQGVRGRHALETFASVKYVLMQGEPKGFLANGKVIGKVDDVTIVQMPAFLGIGIAFDKVMRESDLAKLPPNQRGLAVLRSVVLADDVDPGSHQVIDTTNWTTLPTAYKTLTLTEHGQNHIAGNIELSEPAIIVYSIPLDDGWKATLNSESVPIERVNYGLMGIRVPAGSHQLEITYSPPLRSKGLVLSIVGLLALGGVWKWQHRQPEESKEEA